MTDKPTHDLISSYREHGPDRQSGRLAQHIHRAIEHSYQLSIGETRRIAARVNEGRDWNPDAQAHLFHRIWADDDWWRDDNNQPPGPLAPESSISRVELSPKSGGGYDDLDFAAYYSDADAGINRLRYEGEVSRDEKGIIYITRQNRVSV